MGTVYTHFQTKKAQKPSPLQAAHTYIAYIREYPCREGGGGLFTVLVLNKK